MGLMCSLCLEMICWAHGPLFPALQHQRVLLEGSALHGVEMRQLFHDHAFLEGWKNYVVDPVPCLSCTSQIGFSWSVE